MQEKHLAKSRVLLADDHPDFLAVVARLLEEEYEVVAAVGDGESLLRAAACLARSFMAC